MEEKVNKTGKVLALCSQKGGVGKTTSCVNLAVGLVKAGKKVLVIDNDPQGSMTASLGYQNPDELPVTLATILARINLLKIHLEFYTMRRGLTCFRLILNFLAWRYHLLIL